VVFQVYAGISGTKGSTYPDTNGWHTDCGGHDPSDPHPMSMDIFAPEGTTVRFSVHNNGSHPLTFRCRVDCTNFLTEVPSSVMVEVNAYNNVYLFRYAHINVAADIPGGGWSSPWGAATSVLSGQTRSKILGTLCDATVKHDSNGNLIGNCSHTNNKTDIGGLCSSGPHLHQAASNGGYDGCISADANGNCGHTRGARPNRATVPSQISTGLVLFHA